MDVRFLSPHDSRVIEAEVEPTTTAGQVLVDLVGCNFLVPPTPSRAYGLVNGRTGQSLLPGQRLNDAGVRHGDVVEVIQATEGALEVPCRS